MDQYYKTGYIKSIVIASIIVELSSESLQSKCSSVPHCVHSKLPATGRGKNFILMALTPSNIRANAVFRAMGSTPATF